VLTRLGRWWVAIGAAAALVAGLALWLAWPSGKATYDPPARSRQYIAFTACLLTGPAGVADGTGKVVWSGMQAASAATRAQVTYTAAVPVGGVETVGSVAPFANTMIQQRCDLILAVGTSEVAAVQLVAEANTGSRFVLVGGGAVARNVAVVPLAGAAGLSARVATVVEGAVGGQFSGRVVS
jgi:basic membrane lipoprotein Med (substrate-binding protein (PBP1-ABC) superfamily)